MTEADRAFARRLAAESLARGDPTGWFETLYAAADQGTATVPWADYAPNHHVRLELAGHTGTGRAVVVGCGLGDDAELLASRGYTTTAFDISATAVAVARRRFPGTTVEYVAADLRSPPPSWTGSFDLVVEVFTVQVLTGTARRTAVARIAAFVAPGGRLLVVAGARNDHDDPGSMPWPLTRQEIESFQDHGLQTTSLVDVVDDDSDGRRVRRWRAWFTRPAARHGRRPPG